MQKQKVFDFYLEPPLCYLCGNIAHGQIGSMTDPTWSGWICLKCDEEMFREWRAMRNKL
jgi:hypothetical protein